MTNYFDEPVAATYDDDTDPRFTPAGLARESGFLADLVGPGGRALELAIGTGRVALPLAERGLEVHGIELSPAMVDRLRAKPRGADLPVAVGDMSSTRVPGEFDLVYLVFNTIGNLTSQDAQVACFANAAAHLRPGGCFVVETGVPGVSRVAPGERYRVFSQSEEHVGVDEYDAVTQLFFSHHYSRQPDGSYRLSSVPFRYAWPAELDLMARIAGMSLRERWADWERSPFTAQSPAHVSVWQKS